MQDELFELHASVEEQHWWFTARREIVRRLLSRVVPPGEGKRLVDLGCGTGGNLAALAGDWSCAGFDPSPRAIGLARESFPSLEFRCTESQRTDVPELETADGVLLLDVLEHVQADAAVLASVVERMPPGAHLLLTVPADPRLWSSHDEAFGHLRRYEDGRLVGLWRDLPVTARLVSPFNSRLYPIIRLVRALNRRRPGHGPRSGGLEVPARLVNRLLYRTFAGEATRLLEAVDVGGARPFRRGASWVAVLRRE